MDNLVWFVPALLALLSYGVGQGLVKKYIGDVSPARFSLFLVVANTVVSAAFYLTTEHPPLVLDGAELFYALGVLVYLFNGIGWIFYFRSILLGPISIVGTLSAAYPALTVVFAAIFLGERLVGVQYAGVALVIVGCIVMAYTPQGSSDKKLDPWWMAYAGTALLLWGAQYAIQKYAYGLPGAHEAFMALCSVVGGWMTLGVYGLLYGRTPRTAETSRAREWSRALVPMSMMAGGDLGVIIASRYGPASIVTPLTGAYPVVTIAFAALALRERISGQQYAGIAAVIAGMYMATYVAV